MSKGKKPVKALAWLTPDVVGRVFLGSLLLFLVGLAIAAVSGSGTIQRLGLFVVLLGVSGVTLVGLVVIAAIAVAPSGRKRYRRKRR